MIFGWMKQKFSQINSNICLIQPNPSQVYNFLVKFTKYFFCHMTTKFLTSLTKFSRITKYFFRLHGEKYFENWRLFNIIVIICNLHFETLLHIFKIFRTVMHSLTFGIHSDWCGMNRIKSDWYGMNRIKSDWYLTDFHQTKYETFFKIKNPLVWFTKYFSKCTL